MERGLLTLGIGFFLVEILVGFIYGLTLIPWDEITKAAVVIVTLVLWNLAGVAFILTAYLLD